MHWISAWKEISFVDKQLTDTMVMLAFLQRFDISRINDNVSTQISHNLFSTRQPIWSHCCIHAEDSQYSLNVMKVEQGKKTAKFSIFKPHLLKLYEDWKSLMPLITIVDNVTPIVLVADVSRKKLKTKIWTETPEAGRKARYCFLFSGVYFIIRIAIEEFNVIFRFFCFVNFQTMKTCLQQFYLCAERSFSSIESILLNQ